MYVCPSIKYCVCDYYLIDYNWTKIRQKMMIRVTNAPTQTNEIKP